MKTRRLTVAQALVEFLDNQYISVDGNETKFVHGVIGIFGHGNVVGLGEALYTHSGDLKYYQGKNEQSMGHIAIGYAKQKNRKQIMAVTSSVGPGALNMVTAAGTATVNRIPVLFLPGDVYADRQPSPVLQQVEDPSSMSTTVNDCFKPVSAYWDCIHRPEQLMSACINAMRVLTNPSDTGAVTLCLPQDVQGEAYDFPEAFFEKRVHFVDRTPLAELALERATKLIKNSKKPFMIVGGGLRYSEAGETLKSFSEKFNIPYGETQGGKGTIVWDHAYNTGGVGICGSQAANRLAKDADLIIGVGTRLNDFVTGSKSGFGDTATLMTINVNDYDAYKMNAKPFIVDAKKALSQLEETLGAASYRASYTNEIQEEIRLWNREVDEMFASDCEDGISQSRVLGELNEKLMAEDAIIVAAGGSLPSDLERVWRTRTPGGYHLEYGFSCMGYEIAGAVGAKMAEPDREVYAILGDGSYLMLNTELVTAMQEGIKVNVVLLDNSGFQCIHNLQRGQGIPTFGTVFKFREEETDQLSGGNIPIDFAMNAESYGMRGYRVNTIEALEGAFRATENDAVSTLIDIKVLPGTMTTHYDTWWRVGTPEVSELEAVNKAYIETQEGLKRSVKI